MKQFNQSNFIMKGNLIYSNEDRSANYMEHGYVVCDHGAVAGVFPSIPEQYSQFTVFDYEDRLIIPGMSDLHIHAPQYTFRGLGMDLELLEWLNTNTFPEEANYSDTTYARQAYELFTNDLVNSTTTRACIFATIHNDATLILMNLLEQTGLRTYVGRVNMDRNGGKNLEEESADVSYQQTRDWILFSSTVFSHTQPILTPRFIPSCSDELLRKLKRLQMEYHLPVQSHLSENLSEIDWVKELVPSSSCYGDAYDQFGLFGKDTKTVMAHCVYSTKEEIELMKKNGVFIAHCPESNINLSSGIAPIRTYLEEGLSIGLGSDVAGASSLSLLKGMEYAVQSSKLYYRMKDPSKSPLSFEEVFYLATLGGGKFFGQVGTFAPGYEFDAVVLDDSKIHSPKPVTLKDRMERAIYQTDQIHIAAKYCRGYEVFDTVVHKVLI